MRVDQSVKRKDIIEIFSQILPQKYSENLCDLVLKRFGNRNEIDFEKTVMSDMTIRKWTIDEKLIWFFNIFDRFYNFGKTQIFSD